MDKYVIDTSGRAEERIEGVEGYGNRPGACK